jgi:hypothetical protein
VAYKHVCQAIMTSQHTFSGECSQKFHSHAARAPDVGGMVEARAGKHDVRRSIRQGGLLDESAALPTLCMSDIEDGVRSTD